MKVLLTMLAIIAAFSSTGLAAERAGVASTPNLLSKATIETLTKSSQPSRATSILSALSGEWNFDLRYWSDKDAEPQLSTGSAANEMILGDTVLSSKMVSMINIGGENILYQSQSLVGYDPFKKLYTSALVDTMNAGVTNGAGQYNEKTKTLEEKGSFTNPLIGKERGYRSELQVGSGDEYTQSIFILDKTGKEYKVLELSFRRKM